MSITRADWLARTLTDAGLTVVQCAGWEKRGRPFTDLTSLVWHHDASPTGDSPGVPAYMLGQQAAGKAWAQLWVDRTGAWHVLGSGVAFHAGRVRAGMPDNNTSLGVETDHTTGEAWPAAQIDGLRRGSAAILTRLGRDAGSLHFHKSICDPPGRKSDPDGLDLTAERAQVRRLLAQPTSAPSTEDLDMTKDELRTIIREEINRLAGGPRVRDDTGQVVDRDPVTISVADVLTRVEASEARILDALKAKQ